jgi:hypothetical protein
VRASGLSGPAAAPKDTPSLVLDLTEVDRVGCDGWRGVRSATQRVRPHAVKVDRRADLDEWLARFEQLGVDSLADRRSPIADREYGAVLTSKDPDNIPFEMSFEDDHP